MRLTERLANMSVPKKEANLRNKLSRGKFIAASMLQFLSAIGCQQIYMSADV
ncbi:DUF6471 domain-containing protein [Nisaea denitrificans]|uniref:DUF6471 domain-containing protein n=1 Tax=Nisaea denitrificans TaxID=390877 RepID=UPI003CCC28E2